MLAWSESQCDSQRIGPPRHPAPEQSSASRRYFCPVTWSLFPGIRGMLIQCNISVTKGRRLEASRRCGSLRPRGWGSPSQWWRCWTCSSRPPAPSPRWGRCAPWGPGRCTALPLHKCAQPHPQLFLPKTFRILFLYHEIGGKSSHRPTCCNSELLDSTPLGKKTSR